MRKAIKQNPNMIRTMVGLAFSLILLLSYAVYGATMNPDYYVYQNLQDETEAELNLLDVGVLNDTGDGQITRWIWTFTLDPHNLTWINASVANAPSDGDFKMINVAGEYWSHEKLSNPDAKDFICAEEIHEGNTSYWIEFDCKVSTTHSRELVAGGAQIIGLSHPDPARRSGGTVYAQSISDAEIIARENIDNVHLSDQWQIILELEGDNTEDSPLISVSYVNEEFSSIEQFGLDTATEMLWSLAALFGCFAMLLVPALSVYFAAMYKEKKRMNEALSVLSEDEE